MNLDTNFSQRLSKLRASELGTRLSDAALWGGIATILGRGLPLMAMMLAARLLGAVEFGKLTLLYSTALAFEVFVTAGMAVTCTKFVADLHRKDPARTGRIIDLANVVSAVTALLVGGLVVIFAPRLASDVLAAPDLTAELYWSAALIAILSVSGIQQGILIGFEAFRRVASIELLGGLSILLLVPLGGISYGMQGAFGGMILGYGLRLAAQQHAVARQLSGRGISRRWALPQDEIAVLWRFSMPGMLNSLLWGPVTWCAIAIVAHQPNGHAEIGIFSAANQWFSFVQFLPSIMTQAAFPILTERLNAGATRTAWRLFYGKVLATLGITTLAALIVALLSRFIMGLYGIEYADKWPVLIAVAIAALLSAPQGPIGNFLIAHAKPWSWFVASLVWAGCLLLLVAILRHHGALALAWGHVAAYAARGLFASAQIYRLRPNSSGN